MPPAPAIELRKVHTRFLAGAGSCRAEAHVLRGIDLAVHPSECVLVVGAGGSGKTTLLLCAAGLLVPHGGQLAWFGDASRVAARQRAVYHPPTDVELCAVATSAQPRVHLVDLAPATPVHAAAAWIARACQRGDAVVVCSRGDAIAQRLTVRVVTLRGGCLHDEPSRHTRVAERRGRFVDPSFPRV